MCYVENLTVRLFVQWLEPFFENVQQGKDGANLKSDLWRETAPGTVVRNTIRMYSFWKENQRG